MTDNPTVRPEGGESSDRQAASDALMAALGRYVDGEPVDLQRPTDNLVEVLSGVATDEAIAAVLNAAATVVERYWDVASRGDNGAASAKILTKSSLAVVRRATFDATTVFDRQDDLLAAERRVAELEQDAQAARAALEAAVESGDIQAVLSMRAEVEVTLPGKLAKAREELLELQLQAAQAQLEAARAVAASHVAKVDAARKAKQEAAALLERRGQELVDAQVDADTAAGTENDVRAVIARRSAELQSHREQHARQQQDRIRKLAGLAPAAA